MYLNRNFKVRSLRLDLGINFLKDMKKDKSRHIFVSNAYFYWSTMVFYIFYFMGTKLERKAAILL